LKKTGGRQNGMKSKLRRSPNRGYYNKKKKKKKRVRRQMSTVYAYSVKKEEKIGKDGKTKKGHLLQRPKEVNRQGAQSSPTCLRISNSSSGKGAKKKKSERPIEEGLNTQEKRTKRNELGTTGPLFE